MTTPLAPKGGRAGRLRARLAADPRHPRWVLVVCLVGMFSTSFPATILTISINAIAEELGSVPSTVTWVTTAPMLAAAVATPILGRLGDIRGHRRLYVVGFVVAISFSLLTAAAWSAVSLIAFRTLSQLGASATVPSSFAMVFRAFPPEERVRASALSSATLAGAAVIGVVIGGPLVDLFGWRPIFLVQAAIALAALLPALVVLDPDVVAEVDEPIDYAGAAALAVAAFAVTFGINRLGVWGPEPVVLGVLATAPVAIWALVRIERRVPSPILPLEILGRRNIRVGAIASFVAGGGWMGNFVITPLLLQSVMGLSAGMTSLVSVPRATFIALSSPVASRLGMRHGERRLVVWASVALAAVMGVLAVGAALESALLIVACLAASGWAFGHVQPALLATMGNAVDEDSFGLATSLQQTANQIGSVVGIGLFTAIAADATTPGPFVVVYLVAGACALVVAAVGSRATDHGGLRAPAVLVDDGSEPVPPDHLLHRP